MENLEKYLTKKKYENGLRKTLNYLYDGEPKTVFPLKFIQGNYKRWQEIFNWLVVNEIKGKKLVEFFQNESTEDGGGYHLGVTYIMNKLKGTNESIKGDELK